MDDDKVLIIMTSGPDTPRRCATPFFMAHLAAVMESDVTMFFTIDGIKLLEKGVAEEIYPKAGGKPVSDFRNDAQEAGVKFVACTAATELHDLTAAMLAVADESKTILSF
jgi:predicted peroxiredoxin